MLDDALVMHFKVDTKPHGGGCFEVEWTPQGWSLPESLKQPCRPILE